MIWKWSRTQTTRFKIGITKKIGAHIQAYNISQGVGIQAACIRYRLKSEPASAMISIDLFRGHQSRPPCCSFNPRFSDWLGNPFVFPFTSSPKSNPFANCSKTQSSISLESESIKKRFEVTTANYKLNWSKQEQASATMEDEGKLLASIDTQQAQLSYQEGEIDFLAICSLIEKPRILHFNTLQSRYEQTNSLFWK